jgi:hypothetical protein
MNPGIRNWYVHFKNWGTEIAGKDVCWDFFIVVWMHFYPSNLEKEAAGKFCGGETTIYG